MRRIAGLVLTWWVALSGACATSPGGDAASPGSWEAERPSSSNDPSSPPSGDSPYEVGDYVVYQYDGTLQAEPVILEERVLAKQGLRLEIEVTARVGQERRQWIQVVTDTAENKAKNVVDELYLVEDGARRRLPNDKNGDLYQLYSWTLPPEVMPTGESVRRPVSVFLGGEVVTCDEDTLPVASERGRARVVTTSCPELRWTHGPAALVGDDQKALWSVRVLRTGRGSLEGAPPDLTGWEGFYPPEVAIDDVWLGYRGVPILAARLAAPLPRVVKIVLDQGERTGSEEELAALQALTCTDPAVRAWNEDRCRGLLGRACSKGTCTYRGFGNCSGFSLGRGRVLTAAHCVADLVDDPQRKAGSAVLARDGETLMRLPLGDIVVGKRDFAHHWVSVEEPGAVDVAVVTVGGAGSATDELSPWPMAALESPGAPVFIHGFPRVERRGEAARERYGYELAAGTPRFSFGRVADLNEQRAPLCNVDGQQEHWQLASPCPVGEASVDGTQTWKGPITARPALFTFDSCNGYSGAPIFDDRGRLVAVNVTLISPHDPQERFSAEVRQVAIPVEAALAALKLR